MTSEVQRARQLEEAFLGGLEDAQNAYEEIVAAQAWTTLGYDTFAEWWQDRVVPAMRALSMRPTKEVAASVVEQVRQEEAELPPAQRRTQAEMAEMVGGTRDEKAVRPRSAPGVNTHTADLETPATPADPAPDPLPAEVAQQIDERIEARRDVATALVQHAPDPEAAKRQWQLAFLGALRPAFKVPAQFAVDQAAEQIDDECLDELRRAAQQLTDYYERVKAARPAPDNIRHLRAV